MGKKRDCLNQKGFTLIELISVMIIMGVVASVTIQKFDVVSDTAGVRALHLGIKELNIRESLTWSNIKISADGYTNDADLFRLVDTKLSDGYHWDPGPDILAGGTLHFKGNSIALNRQQSTETSAGKWAP
jgi:prepilin-type N-terminal cleavage/methylation domain-containing protein